VFPSSVIINEILTIPGLIFCETVIDLSSKISKLGFYNAWFSTVFHSLNGDGPTSKAKAVWNLWLKRRSFRTG
jgi:hypothetical protein